MGRRRIFVEGLESRTLLATAPVIDVGDHILQPNKSGQTFQIMVSGGAPVEGEDFECQVADGGVGAGGTIAGPHITNVDILSGTIFASSNTGQRGGGALTPQLFDAVTTTPSGTVAANGVLATVTIDTTGFATGTYDLKLLGTANGDTDFAEVPVTITNGHIKIGTTAAAGLIGGSVFNDVNANGVKDATDKTLAGVTVYLDTNRNGILDTGEATSTSTSAGSYNFNGLAAGSYRVRQTVPSGYRATSPSVGYFDVTLTSGQVVTAKDFGDAQAGSISGNLFNDLDADGVKDSGEAALGNWKLFLDTDRDGVLDTGEITATTDVAGNYTFVGLAAGTYRVREVLNAGWRCTTPSIAYFDISLGGSQAVSAKNFGNTQKVSITGSVFNDLNGSGTKEASEGGLANRKVFLDADKDGIWDSTEAFAMTDASGNYAFKALPTGSYRVREVLPSGWRRTSPTAGYFDVTLGNGASATSKSFGDTQKVLIGGTLFNDLDGDGVHDSNEKGLSNWRIYVDANGDGKWESSEESVLTDSSGAWSFKDLAAGSYKIRVVQQTGWKITSPSVNLLTLSLAKGAVHSGSTFGEHKV